MSAFYVRLNEQGYVKEYDWANSKPLEWKRTNYNGDYEVTVKIYFSKFVDGDLVLDEEAYQAYLEEQSQPQPEPEPTQLDRIEEAVNKSQQDVIDEYTLELISSGIIE